MSFHEVQFPPAISFGAAGGPGFSTTVLTLASAHERRNLNWADSRCEYDVSHGVKTAVQMNELIRFFRARRGKAHGFRFKDWTDYKLPYWVTTPGDTEALPLFFTTNGVVPSTFQLVKVYTDSGGSFTRTINKPVAGTLVLYDNGFLTTDWSVNTATGLVTLGNTLSATTGRAITGNCQFDVPVRFDVDKMRVSMQDIENLSWPDIPVVEIRV